MASAVSRKSRKKSTPHPFALPFSQRRIESMSEEERRGPVAPRPSNDRLSCCVCSGSLDPVDAFAFGGGLACQGCVRDYYKSRPESEIQQELRERRWQALRQLRARAKSFLSTRRTSA